MSILASSVLDAGTDPNSVKPLQRKRAAVPFPTADDGRLIVNDDRGDGSGTHPNSGETGPNVNVHVS